MPYSTLHPRSFLPTLPDCPHQPTMFPRTYLSQQPNVKFFAIHTFTIPDPLSHTSGCTSSAPSAMMSNHPEIPRPKTMRVSAVSIQFSLRSCLPRYHDPMKIHCYKTLSTNATVLRCTHCTTNLTCNKSVKDRSHTTDIITAFHEPVHKPNHKAAVRFCRKQVDAICRHCHLQHLDLACTSSSHPKLYKSLCTMPLRSKVLKIDSLGLLNRWVPELHALDLRTAFVAKRKLTNPSH